jgi:hypothetical protein
VTTGAVLAVFDTRHVAEPKFDGLVDRMTS